MSSLYCSDQEQQLRCHFITAECQIKPVYIKKTTKKTHRVLASGDVRSCAKWRQSAPPGHMTAQRHTVREEVFGTTYHDTTILCGSVNCNKMINHDINITGENDVENTSEKQK